MMLMKSVLPRTFSKFIQILFLIYEQYLGESLLTDTYIQLNTPGDSIINVILPSHTNGNNLSLFLGANPNINTLLTQQLSKIDNCGSLSGFDSQNSICLLKNYSLSIDQTLVLIGKTNLFNLDSLSFYKNCSGSMYQFDSINTHLLTPNASFQVILYNSALNIADSINFTTSDLNNKRSILTSLNFTKNFPFNATLNWQVATDRTSICNFLTFCSMTSFLITNSMYSYTNVTSTDIVSVINTTAYQQICKSSSITNYNSNFDCTLIESKIHCSLNRVQLKPNSLYSFKIEAISSYNSNVSIWQQITSPDLLTGIKMPSFAGLKVMSPVKNQLGFSIFLPSIDQTDLTILNLYLYLVHICPSSNTPNYSIPNNLSNLENCTSNTYCSIICLLQSYSNKEINFPSDITINVVSVSDTNKIAGPSISLVVNSPIIKKDVDYLTFFVLKTRNLFGTSSLNDSFIISPTVPIKVVAEPSGNSSNSSVSIQDWQIILICCIVVVISFIIVGLVLAFVFRKRIKNCCRKYGSKYKPDIGSPYTADLPIKPLPSKSEFHCDDIKRICSIKRADDDFLFEKEFKSLPDYYNDKSSIAANDVKNATKNRYTDIKAYDESRVILKNEEDEELVENKDKLTDYINANYVQGYFYDKKFIATQGPKAETIGDFWRMIEQNNVKIIVMLTDLVENNVIKCQKYWPNVLNTTETYDDYNVTFVDERVYVDYVKRTFNLMKTTKKDQSKIVTQYFYPSWIDKSTPNTDLISIFYLIREINWCYNGDKESPIVVHCSAGIGRTGTYITLDAMMDKIEAESKIDVFDFISKIREKRQTLVQNLSQYIYIHDALCEYCLYKFTDIKAYHIEKSIEFSLKPLEKKDNKNIYQNNRKKLIYVNNRKKKSIAEIEFDKMSNKYKSYELTESGAKYYYSSANNVPSTLSIYYLLPDYRQKLYDAYNSENKPKNRNQNAVCYDFNRVKLTSYEEMSVIRKASKTSQRQFNNQRYINATKLKYLKNLEKEFIITQDPLRNTIVDFFTMIMENDSKIIIALNNEIEPTCVYWPNQVGKKTTYETEETHFSIENLSKKVNQETSSPLFTEQKFKLTEKKTRTGKVRETILKHFIYNEPWPESKIPTSSKGIRDLAVKIQNLSSFSSKPVIVHSHGGASNCSLFCCLCILFNQLFIYGHVDVCRLVRIIKPQKQNLFQSYDHYKYLYEAVYDYVIENGTSFKPMSRFDSFSINESNILNETSSEDNPTDSQETNKISVFVERL